MISPPGKYIFANKIERIFKHETRVLTFGHLLDYEQSFIFLGIVEWESTRACEHAQKSPQGDTRMLSHSAIPEKNEGLLIDLVTSIEGLFLSI